MTKPNEYLFDTNVFDKLIQVNDISVESLAQRGFILYATHIQLDEINDIPTHNEEKANKRKQIRDAYRRLFLEVPTESFVWDVSRWGMSKWSDDDLYEKIRSDLDKLEKKANNIEDALIAETAIKRGFNLVTEDKALTQVTQEHGGQTISFGEFLQQCNKSSHTN